VKPTAAFLVTALLLAGCRDEQADVHATNAGEVEENASARASGSQPEISASTRPALGRVSNASSASPAQAILEAHSLVESIDEAIARFGPNDARVRSLYFEAKDVCGALQESESIPGRSTATVREADPLKEWAESELRQRCADFPERSKEIEEAFPPFAYDVAKSQGDEAAKQFALDELAVSESALEIVDGAEHLLGTKAFVQEAFGNASLSPDAMRLAIRNAALLRECSAANSCGAKSFTTLAYCAQAGCRPGVSLEQALKESLPPRDFEATIGFYRWLLQHRAR
jgi:hypothetical protein